jgi:hypothetical protein
LLEFSFHKNIRLIRWFFVDQGILQKAHYSLFGVWCWAWAVLWRPEWVYGSDPYICPVLWLIKKTTACRVVYHEHDSPAPEGDE